MSQPYPVIEFKQEIAVKIGDILADQRNTWKDQEFLYAQSSGAIKRAELQSALAWYHELMFTFMELRGHMSVEQRTQWKLFIYIVGDQIEAMAIEQKAVLMMTEKCSTEQIEGLYTYRQAVFQGTGRYISGLLAVMG